VRETMTSLHDCAKCICGHLTPVRPSPFEIPGETEEASELTVACECKRVYSVETDELKPSPTLYALSPQNPDAPMRIFQLSVPCSREDCRAPLEVIAVRKSDTSVEKLKEESTTWSWEDVTCPSGHPFQQP
jgi:hypothetical protein